jgi:hypothetical protein
MVALRWTNPANGDFSHVVLRYSTLGYLASTQDGIAVENGSGGVFSGERKRGHTYSLSENRCDPFSPVVEYLSEGCGDGFPSG